MQEYLVFRLYGPMASWGQPAVGGDRATATAPTRSALLGLLGAALGMTREEHTKLAELQQSVCFGIKQTTAGSVLRDYHTAQVPPEKKGVTHRTRKSELSAEKLNTVLSSRDYRCDCLWVVAVWLTPNSTITLEQLQAALLQPVFSLYLGRKSCPPALPLMPQVLTDNTLQQALDHTFPVLVSERADPFLLGANKHVTYLWEGDAAAIAHQATLTYHPWDEPIHRGRWQFKQRTMYQLTIKEE